MSPHLLGTGAASFKRVLGCATENPRSRPALGAVLPRPRHRFLNDHRTDMGRMNRCSELPSAAALRAPRDFHLDSTFESNRTGLTDASRHTEADQVGFHKRIVLW
jgi:hypothetical protein